MYKSLPFIIPFLAMTIVLLIGFKILIYDYQKQLPLPDLSDKDYLIYSTILHNLENHTEIDTLIIAEIAGYSAKDIIRSEGITNWLVKILLSKIKQLSLENINEHWNIWYHRDYPFQDRMMIDEAVKKRFELARLELGRFSAGRPLKRSNHNAEDKNNRDEIMRFSSNHMIFFSRISYNQSESKAFLTMHKGGMIYYFLELVNGEWQIVDYQQVTMILN